MNCHRCKRYFESGYGLDLGHGWLCDRCVKDLGRGNLIVSATRFTASGLRPGARHPTREGKRRRGAVRG